MQASFEVLWEKIIKGDIRAINMFHDLAMRYANEEQTVGNDPSNEVDDVILNNFIERQISERAAEASKNESAKDSALPSPRSLKTEN